MVNDDLSWVPSKLPLQPPLYQSLYQNIQNDIENGILPPYKQLPSQRELSYFLDIHFTTVTHAYELAIKQGLLYSEKGRGTFVSPNGVRDNTIQAQNNASHISDLGILNMGHTPNSLAESTIKLAMSHVTLATLSRYSTNAFDDQQYRQICQQWFDYLQVPMNKNQSTLITGGGQSGLAVILSGLFKPYDTIVVDEYTYSNFIELAKTLHIKLLAIAQNQDGMDLVALEHLLTNQKINGVYVMPFLSNPTNRSMPLIRRQQLARLSRQHDFIIIEDDYLRHLDTQKLPAIIDLAPKNTVYITSFSKIVAPGLRVAFLLYDQQFDRQLRHSFTNLNLQEPTLDFEIIRYLIEHHLIEPLIHYQREQIERHVAVFREIFDLSAPNSPFQWVKINPKLEIGKVKDDLAQQKIHVLLSPQFQAGGWRSHRDYFVRIAIAGISDTAQLQQILLRLKPIIR